MVRTCLTLVIVPIAALVGYLIGTSPAGIVPPHTPEGSPLVSVPPWPVFRMAVALNDFLKAAAEATTLPKVRVIELTTAYWHSQVIYALSKNGLFEALRAAPLTCDTAAAAAALNAPFTCRLMDAGARLGLLAEAGGGKWQLTPTSELLLEGVPNSQKDLVEMLNAPYTLQAWMAFGGGEALRTGRSPFELAHGTDIWSHFTSHPELEKQFDGAMTSFTAASAGSILSSYAFPPNGTICDIGGSEGGTLRMLLQHYPQAHGIVFDRPSVVKRTMANFEAAGLGARAQSVGGDFLGAGLPAELSVCDVFMLKHILHDWDDAAAVKILKNIAAVGKRGAKVAVVEHVMGVSVADMERAKRMMDLNMIVSCPAGAKERTTAQYEALFASAGIGGKPNLHPMRDIISVVDVTLP